MLYKRKELFSLDLDNVARDRYLNKFIHHRKEIKKLKLHEKEFLFSYLNSIISNSGEAGELIAKIGDESPEVQYNILNSRGLMEKAYDLYEIEESYEYLFNKLVLRYYHNLDFIKPVRGAFGELSDQEIKKDKLLFENYYQRWDELITSKKGNYMTHLYQEYNRKLKILKTCRRSGLIGENLFKSKRKEIKLACYHIYYKARSYFDSYPIPVHVFEIDGINYIFDVYSYVHILSRHYMPSTNNFDLEKSFNEVLPFIDIDDLPVSFEVIMRKYSSVFKMTSEMEFFIVQFKTSYYIIWLKSVYSHLVNGQVIQVRTFYKMKEKNDIDKLNNLVRVRIAEHLFFWG